MSKSYKKFWMLNQTELWLIPIFIDNRFTNVPVKIVFYFHGFTKCPWK